MLLHFIELQHKYLTLDDKILTKSVTTERNWVFKVDVQSGIDVLTFPSIGSIYKGQVKHQAQNHDAFCLSTVAIAQCIIGCEKYPNMGKTFYYHLDKSAQA